jgi:hypothetical protein
VEKCGRNVERFTQHKHRKIKVVAIVSIVERKIYIIVRRVAKKKDAPRFTAQYVRNDNKLKKS